MKTIYDNPEYERAGFSGCTWHEFHHEGFIFRIDRGSTNNGRLSGVPAYCIDIKETNRYCTIFTIMTYLNYPLYKVIKEAVLAPREHLRSFDAEIAKRSFALLFERVNPAEFVNDIYKDAYARGKQDGKTETQSAIRQACGMI